ncbi:hypothetical protein BC941DRAFT_503135 [Chlamydoabsidia padenii]|nr:hypothetical protein BC941DRAFT_503135 [Chlamydoabsidia padenii]
MNVSDLCDTPSEATTNNNNYHPTSEHNNFRNFTTKPDKDITTTTTANANANATNNSSNTTIITTNGNTIDLNTTNSRFTLPPLSQNYSILQRLPRLDAISSYEETCEEETNMVTTGSMNEGNRGDTEEIKRLIDKCTTLCSDLARYKTWRKGSERDREVIFDFVTHTAHEILDSLVSMQQQQEAATSNEAEYEMIRQARNWKENRKPKYRRRSKRSMIGQQCHSCHTSETPEWRRGPDGARTLCNACGLHYSKLLRKESVTVASYKILTNGSPGTSAGSSAGVNGGTMNQVDQQQESKQSQQQDQQQQQQQHPHYQHFHNQQQQHHQHQQQNYQQNQQNYHHQPHQHPLQHINQPVSIPRMSSSDSSTPSPSSNHPNFSHRHSTS